MRGFSRMGRAGATLAIALCAAFVAPAAAGAAAPTFQLTVSAQPTHFVPGQVFDGPKSQPEYAITVTNIGGAATNGPITVSDTVPTGVTPVLGFGGHKSGFPAFPCEIDGQNVTCTTPGDAATRLAPGQFFTVEIGVDVEALPEGTTLANQATVSGGGAATAQGDVTSPVSSTDPSFDFLPGAAGLHAALNDDDGVPSEQAGSHPGQLTVDFGFPTISTGLSEGGATLIGADGGLRDLRASLPQGVVVNPGATAVRCTEAQLERNQCPDASQVGVVTVLTTLLTFNPIQTPLFNLVPPSNVPASFGFDVAGAGIYSHINGGVDSGTYSLTADTNEIPAKNGQPVLGAEVQLWGDPSSPAHDSVRGPCDFSKEISCPVTPTNTPLLTMPSACTDAMSVSAEADAWFDPGAFHSASGPVLDGNGNAVGVSGCDGLDFSPRMDLQPTTTHADSSSGVDVDLSLPQVNTLDSRAESTLKKAVVTLPRGTALNPSASNGLDSCTEAEIGIADLGPPVKFNDNTPACPDASKVGSGTLATPLLPDPLDVDLYVADPNDNPFHSLVAGYLVAHGQGVTIKLAGLFDRDPDTGQITATVDDNPQLPFDDLKLHFKGGDNGVLVSPPTCGTYDIDSALTPWSAADPNNPTAAEVKHTASTFTVDHAPDGGPCTAGNPAQPGDHADVNDLPFAPSFIAGTVSPQAGSYSPLVLKISKPDGTQELKQIKTSMPQGLTANLSNVPRCSQADITPGIDGSTNCPAGSQVGTVTVGAGAGPSPFFLTGQPVYLTAGYGGAPFGLAIDVHAKAGPFDLGHVVTRSKLDIDPQTTQVTATSEELPDIIQGIPLHIRSVALKVDRSLFVLNPTSCDAMNVTGRLTGGGADFNNPTDDVTSNVSDHFQVGGCSSLAFKPKLAIKLSGGIKRSKNPALRATLTMPPGNANIAAASVALPHSEFLDQAHIRTVCTRVQFAAAGGNGAGCPPGSVYGRARAITPLLDAPLEGPVYLRANGGERELPDLVAALHGQIDVELSGYIDSVNGGIRTTFATVPDAPVSKFVLEMQGGKKGLLENSTNLCKSTNKATAKFDAQNGKFSDFKPVVKNSCKGKKKGGKKHK